VLAVPFKLPTRMLHSKLARLALASAVAVSPVATGAQAPVERPATHTVKKGDTLWDLAQLYLADPFQWPQIYQLNKDLIKDPHWIYPNQVFRIPGGTATAPVDPSAPQGAQSGRTGSGGMTVFNPARRRALEQQSRASLIAQAPRTAVRPTDYEAAPFMWSDGGPSGGGSVVGTAESVAMAMSVKYRPLGYREHVIVKLPQGVVATQGQKFLTYRLGPVLLGQGQVVIPTGIVQVSSALGSDRADAVLVSKFENVFAGHGVTVLEPLRMPVNVYPTRVEFGLSTRVVWVYAAPELVDEGRHVILGATGSQGLVPGDQVSLRVPSKTDPTKDDELGVAQVTRVTQWGVSAIMLDVTDGGISAGTRAQVSAKMP
jgi:LysM repeat protein